MWESPIDAIYGDVQTTFENEVLKSVQSVHIKVDREELIKALEYDRNQYEKGYADGQMDAIKHGHWIYVGKRGRFPACECSVCGNVENADWAIIGDNVNYCPSCGTRMDEEEDDAGNR